jgi:hypothetical protein
MNHPTEDQLLAFALETDASENERQAITDHLAGCAECRARFEGIENDLRVIGGVRPQRQIAPAVLAKRRPVTAYTLLKAAALIIFGIVVGYSSARLTAEQPAMVSPSYIELSPPADSMIGYAVTDATEIGTPYYERLLDRER